MKPYIIDEQAERELIDALVWHSRNWSHSGINLHAEFLAAFKRICRSPLANPLVRHRFRMYLMNPMPFVIYYRDLPDKVWIAAVAHTSRRFGYWSRRQPPRN